MGTASSKAKAKWNSAHYKQVKAFVQPELADAFKAACETAGVSMAGEISRFMAEYCGAAKKRGAAPECDVSTRRKRRKMVAAIIGQMELIRDAEMRYQDNMPENLRGSSAYESSEESVSAMDEAIEYLGAIY